MMSYEFKKEKNMLKKLKYLMLILALTAILGFNNQKVNTMYLKDYQVPNISFNDDNFYQCVIDSYNKEHNVLLSYDENLTDEQLSEIDSLWCSYKKIKSVSGIEKMSNLENIYLNDNELTVIDLSNNKKLRNLYLSDNKLENLDLSNNTNLIYLSVSDNKLSSIDLRNNKSLEKFFAYDNNFKKSLTVKRGTEINFLEFENNLILLPDSLNDKKIKISDIELGSEKVGNYPSFEYDQKYGLIRILKELTSYVVNNKIKTNELSKIYKANKTGNFIINVDYEEVRNAIICMDGSCESINIGYTIDYNVNVESKSDFNELLIYLPVLFIIVFVLIGLCVFLKKTSKR